MKLGIPEGQVLALEGRALAFLELSDYNDALSALSQARHVCRSLAAFSAELAERTTEVYLDIVDIDHSRVYASEALKSARKLNDPWLEASALANFLEAKFDIGEEPPAIEQLEDAIRIGRENFAAAALARALRCSGWTRDDEGHLTLGMAFLEEAELEFQSAGDIRSAMIGMSDLAASRALGGDHYTVAVRQYSLIPLIRDSGDSTNYAFLLGNLARDYTGLSRLQEAIAYDQQALRSFQKIGHQFGMAIQTGWLCANQAQVGELRLAINNCHKSVELSRKIHNGRQLAVAFWQLGIVQRALNQPSRALINFRRAHQLSARIHGSWVQIRSLIEAGKTLQIMGQQRRAREAFEIAMREQSNSEDVPAKMEVHYLIARSEFEDGDSNSALREVNGVLEKLQGERHPFLNVALQASYLKQIRRCEDLKVEILMQQDSTRASDDALQASESGKSRSLLDAIQDTESQENSRTRILNSERLLKMRTAVGRAFDERLKMLIDGRSRHELDVNANSLTLAIGQLELTEEELRVSLDERPDRQGSVLTVSDIVDASQKRGSTLIEYFLGSRQSYVWVIEHGELANYRIPRKEVIENAVRRWRALATARVPRERESIEDRRQRVRQADTDLPKVGAQLSCMLLGPFIKPWMKDLVIVPDGELDVLPFSALPEDGCSGPGSPIVMNRQVRFTPSLSVFLTPRGSPESNIAGSKIEVFADPVFDLNDYRVHADARTKGAHLPPASELASLPLTEDEAKQIAEIAGPDQVTIHRGFDASKQAFFQQSRSKHLILHIATHGVFDEHRPEFSGLVLSRLDPAGHAVDGFLGAAEIAKLRLQIELVVLSSCSSGQGDTLNSNEDMSVNYAFLHAGAKEVVSTLWSIEDDTSKDLISAFYLAKLHDHLDSPAALRWAQLSILSRRETSSPYYWAAFEITSGLIQSRDSNSPPI